MTKKLIEKTNEFLALVNKVKKLEKTVKFLKEAEEAQRRDAYIDEVENILIGAAGEFFKCRINDKLNAQLPDRQHWEKEWRHHLGTRLSDQILRKVRFNDREKAVNEALRSHSDTITSQIRSAANTMAKYLNASPSKMSSVLDSQDVIDYFNEVENAIDLIFNQELPMPTIQEVPWNNKLKKKKK